MPSVPMGAHLRAECKRCREGRPCAEAERRRAYDDQDHPPAPIPDPCLTVAERLEGHRPATYLDRYGDVQWVDSMWEDARG
jgi:hypothetical protein